MIAPDSAADLRAEHRFDLLAATLIGLVAVLAAILTVVQMDTGQKSIRAQQEAAALAADLSARLETSGLVTTQLLYLKQVGLALALEGTARQIAGLQYQDEAAGIVGDQEWKAAAILDAALNATAATSGGAPVDEYTAGMLNASTKDLYAEVVEQNRQVDLADEYGNRNSQSILGLSLVALAGVLTGLGAVLREGRAGWFALVSAAVMAAASGGLAILAIV